MLEDTFGDIIGKARFGKGWPLSRLAQISGLSESSIESLEGGVPPSDSEIDLLAAALDLDRQKLALIARSAWSPKSMAWGETIRKIDGRIGDYPVNGYLLIDPEAKEGALFDTGYSPDRVIRTVQEEGIKLTALCVTHAHPDHIGGAERIQSATGAPIYLHPAERPAGSTKPKRGTLLLQERMEIPIGRFKIRPLKTPGHTPGGTTYFVETPRPVAFVGDALFAGSIGRAQSPSTYSLLLNSVRSEILSLPKETLLFPGHGPVTAVEEEQGHNPFFVGRF